MIKFIFKIFKFIFTLLAAIIIFLFIFSLRSNMSFNDTLSYFKTFANEILGFNDSEKDIEINSNVTIQDTITLDSFNKYYYYDQLNDTSKIIYNTLENNIYNLKKKNYSIDFSTKFNDLLHETTGQYNLNKAFQSALDAFFYDHPELFYIDLTKISLNIKSISLGPLSTYTVTISPKGSNYLIDTFPNEQAVNIAINQVEKIKDEITTTISDYTTYNKIKYIHDYLVNSIEYNSNYNPENAYNIYGALIDKKVVCEGYAKAFKYLINSLNIECILVGGTATNDSNQREAHMWNYIKLNDNWYAVDVTWDDPIIIGGTVKNNLRYDYFIKGETVFNNSHIPSGKITDKGMLFKLPNLSYKNFK